MINEGPSVLEPLTGTINRKEATVKENKKNTAPGFIRLDPDISILHNLRQKNTPFVNELLRFSRVLLVEHSKPLTAPYFFLSFLFLATARGSNPTGPYRYLFTNPSGYHVLGSYPVGPYRNPFF